MANAQTPAGSQKLRELILYLATRSESDPRFSVAKLNKLLFYCDFAAYRQLGRSITGHSYQKLESGLAAEELIPALERMKQAGDCAEVEGEPFGDRQKRLIARRPAEGSLLSPKERSVADRVVADLWESRGDSMCDLSRDFVGWTVAAFGEVIPYETSFVGDPTMPLTEDEIAFCQSLELESAP